MLVCIASAHAGDFKRITIDGAFEDWAGVAPLAIDPEDASGLFDIKELYVANDDQYLYVRVKLYAPADYSAFHHHVLIDSDADVTTGNPRLGVGSELMIEDGSGYQQKNGGFNEGGASDLDWAAAPTGELTEFEARISRNLKDAEGQLVFTQDGILLAFEAQDTNWASIEVAPDSGGVYYEFAPTPPKATGTTAIVSVASSSWRYDDSGTDLGIDWLAPEYDDSGWKSGAALFGYGLGSGVYPVPVNTPLATGRRY